MIRMEISLRPVDKIKMIALVDLEGELVADQVDFFKDKILGYLEEGWVNLILNFAKVPYVNTVGLSAIVRIYREAQNKNARIKILNLSPELIELFEITKLSSILEVYSAEKDAIDSFLNTIKLKVE